MKRYYLGPWLRQSFAGSMAFMPPTGVVGCIDLASIPQQASTLGDRPVGLFVTTAAVLPSEYELLAEGDCRELPTTSKMQDVFSSLVGYRPQGERLVDLIYDTLTDGSDPLGEDGVKPLMPGANGWCDVHLGGHSRILSAKFEWGKPCSRGRGHWKKVKQLLRKEFEGLFDDAKSGRLKDKEHHRRCLDFWCEKYGVQDWKEFVPQKLQKDVPGRLKHETTITEAFTRTDSTSAIGNDLSWTQVSGTWGTNSNRGYKSATNGTQEFCRADSDLSSADHECEVTTVTSDTDAILGPCCRFSSSAATMYLTGNFSNQQYIIKFVSGSQTNLTSAFRIAANGDVLKVQANGSTIKGFADGVEYASTTDTSITGNTRCGLTARQTDLYLDDFSATDIGGGGGGVTYTQLERTTRGVMRGAFTQWGA